MNGSTQYAPLLIPYEGPTGVGVHMSRRLFACLSLLTMVFAGCGSSDTRTSTPTATTTASSNITISPTSAVVGSSTLELTITGAGFAGEGLCASCLNSVVVWTTPSGTDRLATTFVSSTTLKAAVTANLLANAASAQVTVETWAEGAASPRSVSKPAGFSVKALATGAPTISAISPPSTRVGSPELTVTITGANFLNTNFMNTSVAFWTTDPNNLHDHGTMLNTTFVNGSQLSVVIPATLMANSTSVQIVVLNGDVMGMSDGYFGYPKSNSLTFTVAP